MSDSATNKADVQNGRSCGRRTCIACGKQLDKSQLNRIVRYSDGSACFDSTGKAPGRGAYVCSKTCLHKALETKKLDRALKMTISKQDRECLIAEMR